MEHFIDITRKYYVTAFDWKKLILDLSHEHEKYKYFLEIKITTGFLKDNNT